jgi:uncharacterized membrane protein
MVVHFPIALMFTATLIDFVGLLARHKQALIMGFVLETLGLVSLAAAAGAGWISEHSVHITSPAVLTLLAAHRRDAILTSLMFGLVWLYRVARHRLPGVGASWVHFTGMLLGLGLLTATASLGGALVYQHGVGVAAALLAGPLLG